MIGYMKPQKQLLTGEQRELYQALYCGLCRNLKYHYGLKGTLLINYEIVDILLILEALLTDTPTSVRRSCSLSPLIWRKMIGYDEEIFILGAAVSVMIAGLELNDNIVDHGRCTDKALYSLLKPALLKVKSTYPNEWNSIEHLYNEYMRLEQETLKSNSGFYTIIASCGTITRKIGEILGKTISEELAYSIGVLMYFWGEWIYLIDAIDDYERDCNQNMFNPLNLSDCPDDVFSILKELEDNSLDLINNLPLRRYRELISELFRKQIPAKRSLICQASKYSCKE